jgi:hypothetical protein
VTQPTVSRARARLERQGIVQYAGTLDLKEFGFEIVAMTFGNLNMHIPSDVTDRIKRGQDFLKQHPEIIFFSTGRGARATYVLGEVIFFSFSQMFKLGKTCTLSMKNHFAD